MGNLSAHLYAGRFCHCIKKTGWESSHPFPLAHTSLCLCDKQMLLSFCGHATAFAKF